MRQGFTLVETLIVIAITISITSIFLIYNRSTEQQVILFRDQAVIVGIINRAKALAIERFNSDPRVCAFGVYFQSNSRDFFLFQDLQPVGGEALFGCRQTDGSPNSSLIYESDEKLERFSLDSRMNLTLTDKNNDNLNDLSLVFIPPEISVRASGSALPLPVTITIRVVNGAQSASVTVGEAGQIVIN